MRTTMKRFLGITVATAALAACSESSSGGGTTLNIAEKATLTTALTSSGALNGAAGAAGFAPIAIALLPSIGSLGAGATSSAAVHGAINASLSGVRAATYQGAIGIEVIVTSQGSSDAFAGVVGWDGLNSSAQTVDEIVAAGVVTFTSSVAPNGSTTPIGGNATGPDRTGFGSYFARVTQSSYLGTSGDFVLTSSNFSGSGINCASLAGGGVTSCNYVIGTMSGNFAFASSRVSGTGATTYSQPSVPFTNLPAVRITIVE